MIDTASILIADAVGRMATETLHRARGGRIIAVFASSVYVRFESGLVCITARDVDLGPLSLRTTQPSGNWRGRFAVGAVVTRHDQTLRIGPRTTIAFGGARPLNAPATALQASPDRLRASLSELPAYLPSDPADAGLAALLGRPAFDAVTRRAAPYIAAARIWLANPGASDAAWALGLLGMGPGLTPSGDDLLGGILIALHRFDRGADARFLWRSVAPACAGQTNEVSAELLRAAALGHGSHALHGALEALISGDDLARAVARLAQQGHSSGWDSLLGLVIVLESTLSKERTFA